MTTTTYKESTCDRCGRVDKVTTTERATETFSNQPPFGWVDVCMTEYAGWDRWEPFKKAIVCPDCARHVIVALARPSRPIVFEAGNEGLTGSPSAPHVAKETPEPEPASCPCGVPASPVTVRTVEDKYRVVCARLGCPQEGASARTEKAAIESWNERYGPKPPTMTAHSRAACPCGILLVPTVVTHTGRDATGRDSTCYAVRCESCVRTGPCKKTADAAIEAWNNFVRPSAPTPKPCACGTASTPLIGGGLYNDHPAYFIYCPSCQRSAGYGSSEHNAVVLWNTLA